MKPSTTATAAPVSVVESARPPQRRDAPASGGPPRYGWWGPGRVARPPGQAIDDRPYAGHTHQDPTTITLAMTTTGLLGGRSCFGTASPSGSTPRSPHLAEWIGRGSGRGPANHDLGGNGGCRACQCIGSADRYGGLADTLEQARVGGRNADEGARSGAVDRGRAGLRSSCSPVWWWSARRSCTSALLAGLRHWDEHVSHWFAVRRTATGAHVTAFWTEVANTEGIVVVGLLVEIVLAVRRRWRDLLLVVVGLAVELTVFLTVNEVVRRPRPEVPQAGHRTRHLQLPVGPHRRHRRAVRLDRPPGHAVVPRSLG